ncbi:hypothetical protein DPMN_099596 [Dreissena polymorpha]|uniref:Uncharacterized protein n=1 Tax=Dreissena polymorpha TaxID=45954 RepID=A0A9D4LFR4_DREPO|nr:hypothetical protein DPMN_099596 [Dreissena polymorpha]
MTNQHKDLHDKLNHTAECLLLPIKFKFLCKMTAHISPSMPPRQYLFLNHLAKWPMSIQT